MQPGAIPLTAAEQRIDALDVLRGFALLGMFVVHMHGQSSEPGGLDDLVRTAVWRLVEGKSFGTFALLFGAGFALQLRRAEARGAPFTTLYLRRLVVLALFGVFAHAVFGYNVLVKYAVCGVALLLVRRWSTRALLATAALSAASLALFNIGEALWLQWTVGAAGPDLAFAARRAEAVAINNALIAAEAQPSYGVLFAARLQQMAWFHRQAFFIVPNVTFALFCIGLLMMRHRLFEEPRHHRRVLWCMVGGGVASWVLDNWILPGDVPSLGPARRFVTLGLVSDQWLTFAYVGGALLAMARWPRLTRLPLMAAAGRMALTNYLLQIAAIDVLCSGYGLGLAPLRPMAALCVAITLFVLLATASRIWLQHFRFGPAEWLWRSATYAQVQPLRRMAQAFAD